MRSARILTAVLVLLAALLEPPVMAAQVLTLTGDPWPPYVVGELGQEATAGVGVAIIREVFQHIDGVEVRFPLQPWKRALREVKAGTSDGIALLLKTPEREAYMAFTEPVISSRSLVWYRTPRFPDGFRWVSVDELLERHIGIIRGYSYGADVDRAISNGSVKATKANSVRQLFQMLARDRVEVALANDAVGYAVVKTFPAQAGIVAADAATGADVYHIGFSKRSGASRYVAPVNEVIRKLHNKGVIERMMKEYFDKD